MATKADLDHIGELFKGSANTAMTLKNKDYQWKIFNDFCLLYDKTSVPVTSDTLVRYAVYLFVQRHCCERTVRNHLSNIRRYHKLF